MTDFRIIRRGSITTFEPLTAEAKEWVHEHVALEGWQWLGRAFGVDRRPAQGLIAAIEDWGLSVEDQ